MTDLETLAQAYEMVAEALAADDCLDQTVLTSVAMVISEVFAEARGAIDVRELVRQSVNRLIEHYSCVAPTIH